MPETNNQININPVTQPVLNPPPGQIELIVIKAENVPKGNSKWRNLPIFVSATVDGSTTKATTPVKAKDSIVIWNEKLDGLPSGTSFQLSLTMHRKHMVCDKAIGSVFIPLSEILAAPGSEILSQIVLRSTDGSQHTAPPMIRVKVAYSPLRVIPNTAEATERPISVAPSSSASHNHGWEVPLPLTSSPIPPVSVKPSPSDSGPMLLVPPMLPIPVSLPLVDTLAAVVSDAGRALQRMHGPFQPTITAAEAMTDAPDTLSATYGLWKPILEKISFFMKTVDQVAEVHPYVNLAWGVFSLVPRAIVHQANIDDRVMKLHKTLVDMLEFGLKADALQRRCMDSYQARVLGQFFEQVHLCGEFILQYAGEPQYFTRRLVKNLVDNPDATITEHCSELAQLRKAFVQFTSLQILDKVNILSDDYPLHL